MTRTCRFVLVFSLFCELVFFFVVVGLTISTRKQVICRPSKLNTLASTDVQCRFRHSNQRMQKPMLEWLLAHIVHACMHSCIGILVCECVCVCVCVRARARARMLVYVCLRACMRAWT